LGEAAARVRMRAGETERGERIESGVLCKSGGLSPR
jgi:hypothetical protein